MPRLSARRHSLRFLILYIHNLIEQERQVLRSPFICVSLRKQQTVYTATLSVLCGVLFLAWRPTHFLVLSLRKEHSTIKTLQTLLSLKVVSSSPCGVVQ